MDSRSIVRQDAGTRSTNQCLELAWLPHDRGRTANGFEGVERRRDHSNDVSNSSSPLALPPPFLFLIRNTAATAPPAPPTGSSSIGKVVSS